MIFIFYPLQKRREQGMLGKGTRTVSKHHWAPTMCWGLPRWLSGKGASCQCKEMHETWVQSLGQEDSPGGGNGNDSSILACRIPWTEEPGGRQSMGLQESARLSD